jgi:hypothetical protein
MDANNPLAIALGAITGLLVGLAPALLLTWWLDRRQHRRFVREQKPRRQLWEMERQICEEGMSEEWREWHRQSRQREAEISREARRRLGLPEEADES